MTIAAATVFEVRTTGSDNNGGGFVAGASGSDRSQQDSAFASGNNLTVHASVNTDVLPNGYTAVSADVGNLVQITAGAGFTTGFYQIVSIQGSYWRLDRSPAATSTSGGTWAMGGALISPNLAFSNCVAGNGVWIKSGTYTRNGTWTLGWGGVTSGSVYFTASAFVRGYGSVRGDSGRPTLQSSGGYSGVVLNLTAGNGIEVSQLILDGNGTAGTGFNISNAYYLARDIKVTNCGAGGTNGIVGSSSGRIYSCEVTGLVSGASSGIYVLSGQTLHSCYVHDCPCTGFELYSGFAINCVSDSNSGASSDGFWIRDGGANNCYNCAAYNNGRDGFRTTVNWYVGGIYNSISYLNGRYGINFAGASTLSTLCYRNAYGANTSGNLNNIAAGVGDVTLSGDPFMDAANGDFRLNNVAGAGAACRGAGFPGLIPGLNAASVGYLDIGAIQHQDPVGGGGPRFGPAGGFPSFRGAA